MSFLADTFRDLANDPSWPTGGATWSEDMARLALMVVDAEMRRLKVMDYEWTAKALNINPSHYVNVKQRVENNNEI